MTMAMGVNVYYVVDAYYACMYAAEQLNCFTDSMLCFFYDIAHTIGQVHDRITSTYFCHLFERHCLLFYSTCCTILCCYNSIDI